MLSPGFVSGFANVGPPAAAAANGFPTIVSGLMKFS